MNHKQEWAKVNALVDSGVKDLVEALSGFEKLRTIESCQEIATRKAFVCFYYGKNREWRELTDFVLNFLGPRIISELGDNVDISVRMDSNQDVFAELTIRNEAMSQATRVIQNAVNHTGLTPAISTSVLVTGSAHSDQVAHGV